MQHKRRSFLFVIVTLLALLIAVFISGRLSAPEPPKQDSAFIEGEAVSLAGEIVCLQHVDQDGPVTMECAYGFHDSESGDYFALQDKTQDYRHIGGAPMNQQIRLKGVYHESTDQNDKYIQAGTIEITSIE